VCKKQEISKIIRKEGIDSLKTKQNNKKKNKKNHIISFKKRLFLNFLMTEEDVVKGETSSTTWLARAMRQHPDILALRERLRFLSIRGTNRKELPSFGRDHRNTARTEAQESLPPVAVFQLILQYLREEGLSETREALINESKILCPELLDSLCLTSNDIAEGGDDAIEAATDNIFQHALLPLLHLGVRDQNNLFAPSITEEGDENDEDPEIEAIESYPGEADVEIGVCVYIFVFMFFILPF
jgi:hypothetical protein